MNKSVDYIQRVGREPSAERKQEIEKVYQDLKSMTKELRPDLLSIDWKDSPCFYVSAQDAGRTALVLGPFRNEVDCRHWAYRKTEQGGDRFKRHALDEALLKLDAWSSFYAIGMVNMVNGNRDGKLNAALKPDGLWDGLDFELEAKA